MIVYNNHCSCVRVNKTCGSNKAIGASDEMYIMTFQLAYYSAFYRASAWPKSIFPHYCMEYWPEMEALGNNSDVRSLLLYTFHIQDVDIWVHNSCAVLGFGWSVTVESSVVAVDVDHLK